MPNWPAQPWCLMRILVDTPMFLPSRKRLIFPLKLKENHPTWNRLDLLACRVSGKNLLNQKFQKSQVNILTKSSRSKAIKRFVKGIQVIFTYQ